MSRSYKKTPILKDGRSKDHNRRFRRLTNVLSKSIKSEGYIFGYDEPNRLTESQPLFKLQKEVTNQYNVRDYWVFTNPEASQFIKDQTGIKRLSK